MSTAEFENIVGFLGDLTSTENNIRKDAESKKEQVRPLTSVHGTSGLSSNPPRCSL